MNNTKMYCIGVVIVLDINELSLRRRPLQDIGKLKKRPSPVFHIHSLPVTFEVVGSSSCASMLYLSPFQDSFAPLRFMILRQPSTALYIVHLCTKNTKVTVTSTLIRCEHYIS